jgi:chromosome segregation ATPase
MSENASPERTKLLADRANINSEFEKATLEYQSAVDDFNKAFYAPNDADQRLLNRRKEFERYLMNIPEYQQAENYFTNLRRPRTQNDRYTDDEYTYFRQLDRRKNEIVRQHEGPYLADMQAIRAEKNTRSQTLENLNSKAKEANKKRLDLKKMLDDIDNKLKTTQGGRYRRTRKNRRKHRKTKRRY